MRFTKLLGWAGVFFLASSHLQATELPRLASEPPQTEDKGTIGIVCLDASGNYHLWNSANQVAFEGCVDQVVQTWTTRLYSALPPPPATSTVSESATLRSPEDLIQGIATYRNSMVRANASRGAGH